MKYSFYKRNPEDKVWWVNNTNDKGSFLFSFDKEKVFNLFADYPSKLTSDQKRTFDLENPYWKNFFAGRK